MKKVLCFGEILLRFSPNATSFLDNNIPFYLGGAELNVAAALANWDIKTGYCTAMPKNYLSENIISYLNSKSIDTTPIQFQGDRIGLYFLAQGKDMKNDSVVFDREGSSFSNLQLDEIDWENVLNGVDWLHISAIAASLTQNAADVCEELLKKAKSLGIMVSIDLNYRPKLWKYGKLPTDIMPKLLRYADIVMGNIWAVEKMLGIPCTIESSADKTMDELTEQATKCSETLTKTYTNVNTVAFTFRLESSYFAVLHKKSKTYLSKSHQIESVIDKVGSGDCFMAGLIYGIINQLASIETVNFAASAAVGKLYEKGDLTSQSILQIKQRYL
jgi:2-dehydro-3-deoxygluconokinase